MELKTEQCAGLLPSRRLQTDEAVTITMRPIQRGQAWKRKPT
jgi:hypothetical protein